MDKQNTRRISFLAEWYQEEAAIIRTFIISYYLANNSIEVLDQHNKKPFLKRTKIPDLTNRDFFIGSKVNIFGRQFDLVDYADEQTRNSLEKFCTKTFILIKNSILDKLGQILCALVDSRFHLNKGLMVQFTAEQVKTFLGEKSKGDVETSVLINQLLSGPSIGFELIAENIMEKFKCCLSQSKECAKESMPAALMELFEKEDIRNGITCAQSDEDVTRLVSYFFDPKSGLQMTCLLKNSTLALIKPHAIKEGFAGKIITEITENGFKITALRMHLLERVNCEEFYEVYRGILPEYIPMVAQLASGVSIALEITCTDPNLNTYEEFRKFCGPMDAEIAKLLRPHTLRAKFGKSKVLNAIHCTDLPEDTIIELQYMFKILD